MDKYFLFINNGFFSLVFNEFLILYFCNLEYNTHAEIAIRSLIKGNILGDDDDNEIERKISFDEGYEIELQKKKESIKTDDIEDTIND